ncbi:MAG: hypothetical protein RBR98_02750 [Candidatus Moranbacteria bacterium]|jgi:hypothetical protein|nr:hypothetical protein [Candidatus Moranbacteria bacterium]
MKSTNIFFVLLFVAASAFAQTIDEFNKEILQSRVKQLDEFFFLFNNSSNNKQSADLIQLFERDFFICNDSLCNSFVENIVNDSLGKSISFYDSGWYAQVNCKLNFNKKTFEGSITLKPSTENGATRWVIVGVNSEILHFLSASTDSSRILNPYSHETNFINLRNALQDTANLRQYLADNFKVSNLTLFLYLVMKGEIQFVNVQRVTFCFTQIGDWIFEVSFVNRLSHNSGWLITGLRKKNYSQKQEYLNNKLNLE